MSSETSPGACCILLCPFFFLGGGWGVEEAKKQIYDCGVEVEHVYFNSPRTAGSTFERPGLNSAGLTGC